MVYWLVVMVSKHDRKGTFSGAIICLDFWKCTVYKIIFSTSFKLLEDIQFESHDNGMFEWVLTGILLCKKRKLNLVFITIVGEKWYSIFQLFFLFSCYRCIYTIIFNNWYTRMYFFVIININGPFTRLVNNSGIRNDNENKIKTFCLSFVEQYVVSLQFLTFFCIKILSFSLYLTFICIY